MTCQFWYKYAFKFLLFRSQWYQWYVTNQMIRENLDIAPIKIIIREKCSKHVENIEPRELLVSIRNIYFMEFGRIQWKTYEKKYNKRKL